jgi:hypothetical protein
VTAISIAYGLMISTIVLPRRFAHVDQHVRRAGKPTGPSNGR